MGIPQNRIIKKKEPNTNSPNEMFPKRKFKFACCQKLDVNRQKNHEI